MSLMLAIVAASIGYHHCRHTHQISHKAPKAARSFITKHFASEQSEENERRDK